MAIVSVVIPTYNRANLLKRAVESVLAQTFSDWELFVVDNGSADSTAELMRGYAERDSRIHFLFQPVPHPASSRNAGLKLAQGTYVAFLDDDDEWLPEKLELQGAYMEANPKVGFSYTYTAGGRLPDGTLNTGFVCGKPTSGDLEDLLNWPNFNFSTSSMMVRKSCVDIVGGFNPSYRICEDYDFQLRICKKWPMASIEKILTVYGAWDGRSQLSSDPIRNQLAAIQVLNNLELTPECSKYERRRQRHIARIHYSVARDLIDLKRYREAGKHFFAALAIDPLVGQMVRRPGERGISLIARIVKPYLSVPWCALKAVSS